MLYNKSLAFSTGWMIIWKRASRPEGEAFVTCEFVWSLVQICSGRSPGRTIQHLPVFLCLRLQTIIIIFLKKSELAHENYTMKSLLFILHVFCSIYCLVSSWAQLQCLLHHFLCSSYPFMDLHYLALQSKQSNQPALHWLITAILSVSFVLATLKSNPHMVTPAAA